MSGIRAEGLAKVFGGKHPVTAIDDVSFDVAEGELLVLLGPSGCGKTTTLRCLSGLENPDRGRIRFADRTIFDRERRIQVKPHRRGIGLVFQSFALWPHMSARRNIEFPLRAARTSRADREVALARVTKMVDLQDEQLAKRPSQLSGGQQQRVALARALVNNPAIVLFDEPLSNLDAHLREQLRSELNQLHRAVGFTGLYVTHDLTEAVALGDRIAVMNAGRFAQVGTPKQVFEQPAEVSVARLLGLRRMCGLSWADGQPRTTAGAVRGDFSAAAPGPDVDVHVRPDRVRLVLDAGDTPVPDRVLRISGGRVAGETLANARREVIVELADGSSFQAHTDGDEFGLGDPVALDVRLRDVNLFDAAGQRVELGGLATGLVLSRG